MFGSGSGNLVCERWLWLGGGDVFLLYPDEVVGVIASLLCLTKEVVDGGLVEFGSA